MSSRRTQLVAELHVHRLHVCSELLALGRVFTQEGGELCWQLQRQIQREAFLAVVGLLRAEALERQRGAKRALVVLKRHALFQVGHERLLLEELAHVCEHTHHTASRLLRMNSS